MRMLWARVQLTAPSLLGGRFKMRPLASAPAALRDVLNEGRVGLRPYERLAGVYHAYASSFCPGYVPFLRAWARQCRLQVSAALDLACGAGTLTGQLAGWVPRVVGLDLSREMLAATRQRLAGVPNLRFEQGDFRQFDLGERVDVVVSAGYSMNYLRQAGELGRVFGCVSGHLRPRGLFAFDALDHRGLRRVSGRYIEIRQDGEECYIVLRYDEERRVENSLVFFGGEAELHRRIPIEPEAVLKAAAEAGFAVRDWFSLAGFGLLKYGGYRNFFLLQQRP